MLFAHSPCQSQGQDSTASLPALNTDDIAEPVAEHGPTGPCSLLRRYNVEITVRPCACRSPAALFLFQDPSLGIQLLFEPIARHAESIPYISSHCCDLGNSARLSPKPFLSGYKSHPGQQEFLFIFGSVLGCPARCPTTRLEPSLLTGLEPRLWIGTDKLRSRSLSGRH